MPNGKKKGRCADSSRKLGEKLRAERKHSVDENGG